MMTSPNVLAKNPVTPEVYISRSDLSRDVQFSNARRKIFAAKTEDDKWLVLCGLVSHLLDGLPECQRRALLLAAIWRLAESNVRTLSRRKRVASNLSIGHDVAETVRDALAEFDRLDAERIAVDAFQMMSPVTRERKEAKHAASDL